MRFELTKLFAFCTMAFLLCSCSSYQKYQTSADQNKPFDCTGLHMEHASWYFVDEYNQSVTATGRCSSGMKHSISMDTKLPEPSSPAIKKSKRSALPIVQTADEQ